ncbi:hypothetical protein [Stygiolobus caldivivus]|uniref:MFS transporter n=1 Tax=Stygiolobus caldivivus TaxID=2824673 RepID=A0A8D5ZJT1_9CREN|nr:hypothetical protein [Stygiolobus caldivivus]BCU70966.1 hypothetical protein KN1_22630 [Stygiolobus caldivivus]
MRKIGLIILSWLFWGVSYYLSYPFISIYAVQFIPSRYVSLVYVFFTLSAIPMPLLGAKVSRKLGVVKTVWLGMFLSGFGYLVVSLAKDFSEMVIGFMVSYTTFLSLPNFYSYMSSCGKGTISRVWGISILPSLFTPSIAGVLGSYIGLKYVFLLAGVFNWASSLPVLFLDEKPVLRGKMSMSKAITIPVLVVFPIALVFPYVFLEIKTIYRLSDVYIGVFATSAEAVGMVLTLLSSYVKRTLLSVYLFLFSLIPLIYISPVFSIFFGSWEAIIPSSLENLTDNSPETYAVINSLQQVGWLIGFIVSAISFSPLISILISSAFSLALSILLFFTRGRLLV